MPSQKMPVKTKAGWMIEEISRNVHKITFRDLKPAEERCILVTADHHWDNAHTRLDLLEKHLSQAVERDAPVFAFGDTFCAMQGKWDKRADQNQLRPEHRGNNYLDLLKRTAAEWYMPYASNLALITPGNHEGSIALRHQTDLTAALVERLSGDGKNPTRLGGYWGFVILVFEIEGRTFSKVLFYHHGFGGGGEVTRGLIDNNRVRGQYAADIFVSGHIHRRNADENTVTETSPLGRIRKRQQIFLRCASYKDEDSGWHAEQGRASRPLGGWWLTFRLIRDKNRCRDVVINWIPATE